MALRRTHRKSRHGCVECKRRRVKCDEGRPVCSNCSKRQAECEYESIGSLRWTNEEPRTPQRSSKSTPEESQPPDPTISTASSLEIFGRLGGVDDTTDSGLSASPASLNLTELELMMQWCNSTYQVASRNERTDHVWRCLVPEEALAHPFLMYGILALSALHLARTRDDHRRPTYSSIAVAHQNQALTLFRELLDDINESNAKAMFSFASVVALYTFGFPHEPDLSNPWTNIDDLHQVLVLIRGVQQVINTAAASLIDSNFKPLLQPEENEFFLSDDARLALEELLEVNHIRGAQDENHNTALCEDSIHKLMDTMGTLRQDLTSMTTVGRWAIKLRGEYVDMVREHAPLALVILAYYCVILHRVRNNWCLDYWGSRVSRAIWLVLDDQWRPLARWPMVQIFGQRFLDEENTMIG